MYDFMVATFVRITHFLRYISEFTHYALGVSQYIDISIYRNTQEINIVSRYEMRIAIYRDFFIFWSPSSFSILSLTCRNRKVKNIYFCQILGL